MFDAADLLNTLFGIGQMFSILLLLFGAYLSMLKPALSTGGSEIRCQRHDAQPASSSASEA